MNGQKISADSVAFWEEALAPFPCQKKILFGCPAYFAGSNMFSGIHHSGFFLRLAAADRGALREAFPGTAPFEPLPGRTMREYLLLPETLLDDPQQLALWLQKSFAYAAALPPKKIKKKSR